MTQVFDLSFDLKADRPNAQKLVTGQGFQTLTVSFAAGQTMPAHKHPNMNVLLQVVKGELELISEGERIFLRKGQLALFSGDTLHSLENTHSDQTNVVVTAIPKPS